MQISCSVYPEISTQDPIQGTTTEFGGSVQETGPKAGKPDFRRAFDGRPCAYVDCDSAEVCGVASGGLYQGEKRDPLGTSVWGEEA